MDYFDGLLAFYQDFSQEESTDPDVRYETIEALLRVYRIERKFGELAKAKETLQQAFSQSKELTGEFPDRPEFQLQLGSIHLKRSGKQETILANGILPNLRDAFRDSEQKMRLADELASLGYQLIDENLYPEGTAATEMAIEIWESLVKNDPTNFDYRKGLADAYYSKGLQIIWMRHPDHKQSEAAFREAERRLTELLQERPNDQELRRALNDALLHLANVFVWTDRHTEAEEIRRRNVKLLRELARELPDDRGVQNLYGFALLNLANLIQRSGDNESIDYLNEAVTHYERLAKRYPEVGYSLNLWSSLTDLAIHLRMNARYEEARQAAERVVKGRRERRRSHPDNDNAKAGLAMSLDRQAMILIDLGDHAGAAACLDESASIPDVLSVMLKREEGDQSLVDQIDGIDHFFYNSLLLVECVTLAEQDQSLTPAQRLEACRIYREKSADWQRRAAEAIPGVLRDINEELLELVFSIYVPCNDMIEKPVDPFKLSPRDRRIVPNSQALTIKAFIRAALDQAGNTRNFHMFTNLLAAAPEIYRDPELALAAAKRAVAADPQHRDMQDALGWALYRAGDWQSAVDTLSKIEVKNECQPLPVLAMAYWKLGEHEKARATLEAARTSVEEFAKRTAEAKKQGIVFIPMLPMSQRLLAEAEAMIAGSPIEADQQLAEVPADAHEAAQPAKKESQTPTE